MPRVLRSLGPSIVLGSFALSLAVALSACGGRIAGETDPIATRVSGTKTGTPSEPADPDAPGALPSPTAAPGSSPLPSKEAPFPWGASCRSTQPPTSPPRPPPAPGDHAGYLAQIRHDVVGHWRGVVATPWEPVYEVFVAFDADGHYASRSLHAYLPAFYYGTDLDTDLKKWALSDVASSGVASGTIDIAFQYGSTFGLPAWSGKLQDVTVDAAAGRLSLSFLTSDGHGQVRFTLWRCPQ